MSLLSSAELDSFIDAMRNLGIQAHGDIGFDPDGKVHRFRVDGDKSGSLNGWYVLYVDGALPAGAFGSWKTGASTTWCSKSESALLPQEREEWRQKLEAAKLAREAELLKVWQEAEKKAKTLWDKANFAIADTHHAEPGDENMRVHPYIVSKGVKPFGIKQMKTSLMVPIRNASGTLTSLQFIQAEGSKRFLTGGKITGCYFSMGRHASMLCICEGFATGASIYEATGYSVAVAFNAGNLAAVAKVIREKFPDYTIIICADNDVETDGNPGLSNAAGAAEQVHGMLAVAKFLESDLIDGKVPTDFNDLHRLQGLDAVRAAIDGAVSNSIGFDLAMAKVAIARPVRTLKEFDDLIDGSDDFEWLTDIFPKLLSGAGLKRPAIEFLIAKAAKKAAVPKSALMEVLLNRGGNSRTSDSDDQELKIDELNLKHAVLPLGGRILIMNRDYDPVMDKELFSFSTKTDIETRYCNQKVWVDRAQIDLGTFWLNHPRRSEYQGLVFSPGLEQQGFLNLWMGWGVVPKEGSCKKYLEFVFDVICSGDNELFDYIIHWCAHLVQKPQELPETALVFRGREGIGKNKFVEYLRDIVGREHYLMLSSLNQVTGRFSGHLSNVLLVFCNESIWGGDKSAQGVLKSMITDDVQPIEYKGRDLIMLKSYRRMIFATNENWAVPRGADDRRYVITDVSDAHKGDYDYFRAISDEMANGGTEALMNYLLGWDITGWHPREIPKKLSICGWELKIRSGGSMVQWWFDLLLQGWIEKNEAYYSDECQYVWPQSCLTEILQKAYLTWCVAYKITHPEHSSVLGRQLHDWGIKTSRPRKDNPTRKLYYLLPALEEAQAIFSERFLIPLTVWASHDEGLSFI